MSLYTFHSIMVVSNCLESTHYIFHNQIILVSFVLPHQENPCLRQLKFSQKHISLILLISLLLVFPSYTCMLLYLSKETHQEEPPSFSFPFCQGSHHSFSLSHSIYMAICSSNRRPIISLEAKQEEEEGINI